MLNFAVKRILALIPLLLVVTFMVFSMRVLVPGDPIEVMFFGQQLDQVTIDRYRQQLGLDLPWYQQYFVYVSQLLSGELGTSIKSGQPVAEEISARYLRTLYLAFGSLTVAAIVGVSAGTVAAAHRGTLLDAAVSSLSLLGISVPAFWLGLIFINIFALKFRWFPTMGYDGWRSLVLPSLTIGLIAAAIVARLTRSAMLEVINSDFMRTAKAKGLRSPTVVLKHGLRNASVTVVTILGLQFGYLLGGTFVIEIVFGLNGIGALVVNAITQRDFPVIQGAILVIALTYTLVNLTVDLLYGLIDPRVSYS
jgi:ABC-type dipeptide/oligopeptide/nickel transport system permease component